MPPTSHQGNICNHKWRWHHQEIFTPLHKWKSYPSGIYPCSFFDAHLERCPKRMLERACCGLRQHVGIKFSKIWILKWFVRCNVDRMKMMGKPLPLPGYEDIWLKINKIIGIWKLPFPPTPTNLKHKYYASIIKFENISHKWS